MTNFEAIAGAPPPVVGTRNKYLRDGPSRAAHRTSSTMDLSALRVALFSDTYVPQVNGVTRTLSRLTDAIESRGGAVRVFTPDDPSAVEDARVHRFSSRPFFLYPELRAAWPSAKELRRHVRLFRPNIAHLATPFGMGLAGRRFARECNLPFVSSYHTSFAAYSRHYGFGVSAAPLWHYLRWFHNSGLRTYGPSQSVVSELDAHGFQNTAVWSRGVDAQQFSPAHRSSALRCIMGAVADSLVVTYVGRLAVEKGLAVALRAMHIATAARPGRIVFACVGDGPFGNDLRRDAPVGSWIPGTLAGQRLSEAYASSDVFFFPSTTDTFGNVMVEAMASGLPVVGADVGPTRELVGSDRGWLVSAGDADAFAKVFIQLVDNRDALINPRRQSLEFARANDWDTIWNALLGDYAQLAAPRIP